MTCSDRSLPPTVAVVMAKPSESGRAKTRLAESIGGRPAVRLYSAFLEDTARLIDEAAIPGVDELGAVLAHSGSADHESFEPFRSRGFRTVSQGEGDLGARLQRVVDWCFDRGAQRLVVLGSDSPTLLDRHLADSFDRLGGTDLVLGPSFDGGYYLVGLRAPELAIFEEIDWSTSRVLAQTLRRAKSRALLCELLEFWYDIDTFEDLEHLRFHLLEYLSRRAPPAAPETARVLRRFEEEGLLEERRASGES